LNTPTPNINVANFTNKIQMLHRIYEWYTSDILRHNGILQHILGANKDLMVHQLSIKNGKRLKLYYWHMMVLAEVAPQWSWDSR